MSKKHFFNFLTCAFLSSNMVWANEKSLEERMIETKRQITQKKEYIDDLRLKIKFYDQQQRIGKEFTSKIELLSFGNVSSNLLGLPVKELINIKHNYLIEAENFIKYFKGKLIPVEKIEPISTNLSLIKMGEKFKVIEFVSLENQEFPRYLIKDINDKTYEVSEENFDRFFVDTSIVKDLPQILLKYKEAIAKKTSDYKAMYCLPLIDGKTGFNFPREEFIKNAEDFDSKILDYVKNTDSKFKISVSKLSDNNKVTYDPYLYSTNHENKKKLCYGMYFKDSQSFLNSLYYLKVLLEGGWKI